MILFPPAKINLGLHILFKRNDGYHELESAMYPIPFTDVLEILPSEKFEFKQTGLTIDGDSNNNLCVKAYQLLNEIYNIPPVYIHLRKIIPMGGGLGGGSSDGSFILTALNSIFNLNISVSKLEELASQLGSDCPFFIQKVPQIAKGRGEILNPIAINLEGYYLKLINIGVHVGTKEAYDGAKFSTSLKSVSEIITQPISTWKNELVNDFEATVFTIYPELQAVKDELYNEGAIYASMSGSGSTLFGIFEKEPRKKYSEKNEILEIVVKL
jgi:4-diphosphocytidyl-2-C-methyl-D-erythritol kinase